MRIDNGLSRSAAASTYPFFSPVVVPKWKPRTPRQYFQTSQQRVYANLMGYAQRTTPIGAEDKILPIAAQGPYQHAQGRTNAHVTDSEDPFAVALDLDTGRLNIQPQGQRYVKKDNNDPLINDPEYRIQRELHKRGLPVARIIQETPGGVLYIEHLGKSVDQELREAAPLIEWKVLGENSLLGAYIHQAGPLIASFDSALDSILTDAEKDELEQEMYDHLAAKMGISASDAKNHYHLLRLAQSIPGCTTQDLPALVEIARELQLAQEKFGCWTANVFARNMYAQRDESVYPPTLDLKVSDFNSVKRTSLAEAVSYGLDGLLCSVIPGFAQEDPRLLPYNESVKPAMVEAHLQTWEKLTGQHINREEYNHLLPLARVAVNLRFASYHLREFARANNFQDLLASYVSVRDHVGRVLMLLHDAGYEKYEPALDLILSKYQVLNEIVPRHVLEAAVEWEDTWR